MPRVSDPALRERLLRTAAGLFAGRGVAAVNTNQIARAAGVGVGTFYAHFRDKQALLQALVLEGHDAVGRRLAVSGAGPGAPFETHWRALVEASLDVAAEEPDLFRVAFGPDAERVGLGPSPRPLERALRALAERGELAPGVDPPVAARALLAAQAGVLRWWLAAPAPSPRPAVAETLVRTGTALLRTSGSR